MKSRKHLFGTVASAAVLVMSQTSAFADTLAENPLIDTSGDGLIFSDPTEGVQPPGVKAVTFTRTRIDDPDNPGEFLFLDPFEVIITDFSNTNLDIESRGDVVNCLMANNPDIYCDSERGSGKRIKVQLTGPTPFDITYATLPNGSVVDEFGAPVDTSSVDYFTFGKVSNYTGARIVSFSLQLLDADGNLMGTLDPANAALFNLDATVPGIGSRLPDGLFGAGGNEGDIGFFSDDRAVLSLTSSDDTLDFGAFTNPDYNADFGTALLDDTMVPDALFWDDNDNPDDESALVAWFDIAGGGWTYGTLDTPAALAARLDELAGALGVDVADLGYVDGGLVPADIVAAAQANGLFSVDKIEDLRNANLNYTITVGEIADGEFTLRWEPVFVPLVTEAQTDFQFKAAGHLDAAANVPFMDAGNAAFYATLIADLLALDEAEQAAALTSTGPTTAQTFGSHGFETGRGQVSALLNLPEIGGAGDTVTQAGGASSWSLTDDLYGLFSVGGSSATYDASSGFAGYDVDATSFTVGLEKSLASDSSAGIAIGVSNASTDAIGSFGSVDSGGISLAGFTRSKNSNGTTLEAVFGFQTLSLDTTRSVFDGTATGSTATGSTDGTQFFGALSLKNLQDMGAFRIGPFGSIEYYDTIVDGFAETGAGALNLAYAKQSSSTFVGSLGVAGEYDLSGGANSTVLTGSVGYTMASGGDREVEAGFVGLPGASYTVDGLDQDLIDVSIGFRSLLASNDSRDVSISGRYGGAFGDDYDSHAAQFELSIQF